MEEVDFAIEWGENTLGSSGDGCWGFEKEDSVARFPNLEKGFTLLVNSWMRSDEGYQRILKLTERVRQLKAKGEDPKEVADRLWAYKQCFKDTTNHAYQVYAMICGITKKRHPILSLMSLDAYTTGRKFPA